MASQRKWALYVAIVVTCGGFVASEAEAQQSPWPAYGAPAGRIVIRRNVQHIRWRPANPFAIYGSAVLPAGTFTVGVASTQPAPPQPAPSRPPANNGTGTEGTFEDLQNRNLQAPQTCARAMPRTCEAEEPRDVTPPAPEPKAVPQEAPKDVPAQKDAPAQKADSTQKGSPAQKVTSIDVRLHQLLTKSETLARELREEQQLRDGKTYLANSAVEKR